MKPGTESPQLFHPIQVAARRAGISTALLRAWERRYGVVSPRRDASGQRIYSDEQIRRLRRLKQLVDEGRRISEVADLSDTQLDALVADGELRPSSRPRFRPTIATPRLDEVVAPLVRGEPREFARALDRSALLLGPIEHLARTIDPLLQREDTDLAPHAPVLDEILRVHLEALEHVLRPALPRGRARILPLAPAAAPISLPALRVVVAAQGWAAEPFAAGAPSIGSTTARRTGPRPEVSIVLVEDGVPWASVGRALDRIRSTDATPGSTFVCRWPGRESPDLEPAPDPGAVVHTRWSELRLPSID